jgi:hypothetical protein
MPLFDWRKLISLIPACLFLMITSLLYRPNLGKTCPIIFLSFVTERTKSLGPPTVVLVQRTSDNPVGAPDHLISSVSEFLTFPRAFYPSRRHYNSSEIRKCGSSYNNLLLLKSKTKLNIYRPEHNIRVQGIIITNHGRQKLLPK